MLARKLGAIAPVIGIVASGAAYLVETRRAEQAALVSATEDPRRFESPTMQTAIAAKAPRNAVCSLVCRIAASLSAFACSTLRER